MCIPQYWFWRLWRLITFHYCTGQCLFVFEFIVECLHAVWDVLVVALTISAQDWVGIILLFDCFDVLRFWKVELMSKTFRDLRLSQKRAKVHENPNLVNVVSKIRERYITWYDIKNIYWWIKLLFCVLEVENLTYELLIRDHVFSNVVDNLTVLPDSAYSASVCFYPSLA